MQAYSMPCCGSVGGCGAGCISQDTYLLYILYEERDIEICLVVKEKICISVWRKVWLMIGHGFLQTIRLGTKTTKDNMWYHLLVELNHHLDEFLFLTFRLGLHHPFPSQVSQKGGGVHLQREVSLSTEATEEQNHQWSTINQAIQNKR